MSVDRSLESMSPAEEEPSLKLVDPPCAEDEGNDDDDLEGWRQQHAAGFVGASDAMLDILGVVRNVADTDCTVLITGETGTGKEVIARLLHRASNRSEQPLVPLNCAAIPESLIEAELFGHTKGAFTGAVAAREGRIAAAHGGTLFLDEIGDMPLAAQAKLLRVLQDGQVTPIGADRPVTVDVRVVAATNRNLEDMVEQGTFRADLYYRLSVIQVELPPLRERSEDVVLLARHFLSQINQRLNRKVSGLDDSALRALQEHPWRGNVRELAHAIERAVIMKRSGKLNAADLRLGGRREVSVLRPVAAAPQAPVAGEGGDDLNLRRAVDSVEERLIKVALERTSGNRTEAAALLGLNRTTLVERLRKLTG